MSVWLLDGMLAAGLLLLGALIVTGRSPFQAIVLFVVFGLIMALCWARLGAPDVALAEAAIGAGITGALLFDAHRVLAAQEFPQDHPPPLPLILLAGALAGAVTAGLIWGFLHLPAPAVNLTAAVQAQLGASGVTNPVTAVLLNFRGYDTLLEVAVLLLALIGVWIVSRYPLRAPAPDIPSALDSSLLDTLIRLLVPLAVVIGTYLLWAGATRPGGAFQAGAVLAGGGVLLLLSGRLQPVPTASLRLGCGVLLGPAVFAGVALGVMGTGRALLEYPRPAAGVLILLIESALTLSIALILALLVGGGPGLQRGGR
jgi:multisubunit Na+/H+ antiporter MnhB subunit